jgi:hypothetical protein
MVDIPIPYGAGRAAGHGASHATAVSRVQKRAQEFTDVPTIAEAVPGPH